MSVSREVYPLPPAPCQPLLLPAECGQRAAGFVEDMGKPTHPDRSASTWEWLRSVLADGAESLDRRLEQSGRLEPERFSLKEANQRLAQLLESRRLA